MIYQYKHYIPVIDPKAFVHPQATIIGNVIIGPDVYIGAGAVLRGDFGQIILDRGSNVQENCTVHMFPGMVVHIKEAAHVGHGAVIHGAMIGNNSLIGMNAVVMDEVVIGDECIVGALSFIKARSKIPNRSLVVGHPAKIIKQVSNDMLKWKTEGTKIYQNLAKICLHELIPCQALQKVPSDRKIQVSDYKPFKRKYNLPVDYTKLNRAERRAVREQYIEEQENLCYFCGFSLAHEAPRHIVSKPIDWDLFPKNFLTAPIHLQHNHTTGMTEGAVHNYCNAVMWQYNKR